MRLRNFLKEWEADLRNEYSNDSEKVTAIISALLKKK